MLELGLGGTVTWCPPLPPGGGRPDIGGGDYKGGGGYVQWNGFLQYGAAPSSMVGVVRLLVQVQHGPAIDLNLEFYLPEFFLVVVLGV